MSRPTPRIVQIMPANGWRWRWEKEPAEAARPLTAWAIVERDYRGGEVPERSIEGVDMASEGALYGLVNEMDELDGKPEKYAAVYYEPPLLIVPTAEP